MFLNEDGNVRLAEARTMINSVISLGEVGFFAWDMDNQTFEILERIIGLKQDEITSFPDFIEKVVYEKDREIALQDLGVFLKGKVSHYQSSFRIRNKNGQEKWLFCKGIPLDKGIFGAIMYDVTGNNFFRAHDPRTNHINESYFMRKLRNGIQNAKKNDTSGALIYIEINNLAMIVNQNGFDFASHMMIEFSRILSQYVPEAAELARLPHDKIMILFNEMDDIKELEEISKKILNSVKKPLIIDGKQVFLNINIGITIYPEASTDADELVRFSSFSIVESRQKGSNVATFFDEKFVSLYDREMQIESELANAIVNGEFYLVYQPQYNLMTKKISGFEALIRWENDELGFVSPAEFIPVAEEKGYIIPIGRWVIHESIKTMCRWIDKGYDIETISINVSSVEFQQEDFQNQLLKICERYDVPPKKIQLEITERTLITRGAESKRVMNDLIAAGFKIAIDDFGVGYSNISSLVDFEFQILKLDKSLVDNIKNVRQRYFIENLIKGQVHSPYEVLAEGVETEETAEILKSLGCHLIQGYYFSKPLREEEVDEFMEDF